jgi:L-threonylcarbamoyladenylate synthase
MARTTYPTKAEIAEAAAILRGGGLVAFPTETVYGLGANALNADAVRRIFEAKGRPATSPLIVHVDSVRMAKTVVVACWPEQAEILASKFWPGPLSLVLPKQDGIPSEVTAGLQTVGVRAPAHPVALELIREAGLPVAAPSANRFMRLSPTNAQHVRESLGSAVDMVLDGGPTTVGIESTVLSLAGVTPVLLRPGMISQQDLEGHIGPVTIGAASADHQEGDQSPGMREKHYSPATPMLLTCDAPVSGRWVFLWWNRDAEAANRSIRMPADPVAYAREIYSVLHQVDREGWDFIVVEPVPFTVEWTAIHDRLRRASAR